ncbi:MAG: PAS domain S-box protein, partial [Bacteroidota bacterium]|nr:PAS domain S-box protein [Bacteroidota bacterium]
EIAQEHAPDLPFFIISGTVGEEIAVEAMRKGAHDYIMKDKLTRLGEAVKRELRDAETRRQHKFAKKKLLERESQLNSILSAVPLGIGTLYNRKFTFVNDKICEIFGYIREELIGKDTSILFQNDDEYQKIGNFIYENSNNKKGNVNTDFFTKDGRLLNVRLNYSFVNNDKKALTFTLEDITEKTKVEIALEENRRKYKSLYTLLRSISDNMPDMIWAKNTQNQYIFTNKAICKNLLNAVDTDEPKGKNDVFFALRERKSHPDNPEWHTFGEICRDTDEAILKSLKAQRFDEYGNVKGKFLFLDVHKAPFYDDSGRFIGTVGSARDVTKEKENQAKLIESEKKYRNLIENQGEGVVIVNEKEEITFANPAASNIFGISIKQLVGKSLNRFVDNETFNLFQKHTEARRKGLSSSYEIEILRADGTKKNILITASPYFDEEKKFIGVFGIFRDITERTKLLNDLLAAKEKAEESDRLKSAFLANMSHEIRTPMNSIIGFSDLLIEGGLSEEFIKKYLKIISNNGEHLLQLIDDIIDIAKIESNQLTITQKTFDLHTLLDETEMNFEKHSQIVEKALSIRLDNIVDKPKIVYSDEFRIKQLLYNLIQNAIKFTKSGTICFGYLDTEKDKLIFYVKDTGIGIEPEYHEQIFKRFEQANHNTTENYAGTGLGLSICKGIVELLNGKMWLKSEPNKGSTFYFSIPYNKEAIQKEKSTSIINNPLEDFNFSGLNIIVAEDMKHNFLLFKQILMSMGINVLHAKNGKETIELVDANPNIDLVIMDIKMPEMDGIMATEILKKKHKHIPVLAVTALAMAEDKERALKTGCDDYLTKPIIKYSLLEKISKLLSNR